MLLLQRLYMVLAFEGAAYVLRRRRCAFEALQLYAAPSTGKIEALIEPQPKRPSTRQSSRRMLPGHLSSQREQDGVQARLSAEGRLQKAAHSSHTRVSAGSQER